MQKARLVCLLHCIKEYTVLNAVTMLNRQRQVITSFFKVAILLLLSVFLMTIDISEGIIENLAKRDGYAMHVILVVRRIIFSAISI